MWQIYFIDGMPVVHSDEGAAYDCLTYIADHTTSGSGGAAVTPSHFAPPLPGMKAKTKEPESASKDDELLDEDLDGEAWDEDADEEWAEDDEEEYQEQVFEVEDDDDIWRRSDFDDAVTLKLGEDPEEEEVDAENTEHAEDAEGEQTEHAGENEETPGTPLKKKAKVDSIVSPQAGSAEGSVFISHVTSKHNLGIRTKNDEPAVHTVR